MRGCVYVCIYVCVREKEKLRSEGWRPLELLAYDQVTLFTKVTSFLSEKKKVGR